MLKSLSIAALALTLAAGSAIAAPRSLDVWGAHLNAPTYLTDNDSREYEVITGTNAGGTSYMALAGAEGGKSSKANPRRVR
ncbi:MAG: hypothetical protein K2Y56_22460 [Methylobacterium sp.]|uniref:hypothetical protein n=1 Tax=Methylobacterium sp. TaxID=409 RepID=UPI0025EA20B8|nr:hypothetical protein [Methylobacterium sp.]MBX9934243.1 hypothetical protein [Methylobacterium sp.]